MAEEVPGRRPGRAAGQAGSGAAAAAGATVYFADEAGIRSDYYAGTTWAPVGQTPVVKVTGARFSLNMISAVTARVRFAVLLARAEP